AVVAVTLVAFTSLANAQPAPPPSSDGAKAPSVTPAPLPLYTPPTLPSHPPSHVPSTQTTTGPFSSAADLPAKKWATWTGPDGLVYATTIGQQYVNPYSTGSYYTPFYTGYSTWSEPGSFYTPYTAAGYIPGTFLPQPTPTPVPTTSDSKPA